MLRLTLSSPLFSLLPDHEQGRRVGRTSVEMQADSWAAFVDEASSRFPDLAHRVLDDTAIRRGFVLVINDEIVGSDDVRDRRLEAGDELVILAQFAGG